MRNRYSILGMIMVYTMLLCSCTATSPPSETVPTIAVSAMPLPTQAADPYAHLTIAASIGQVEQAALVDDPALLELTGSLHFLSEIDLPKQANRLAVMDKQSYAYTSKDPQGIDCIYTGDFLAIPSDPPSLLYVANAEFSHIDTLSGSLGCLYFVAYNDAAWRLYLIDTTLPIQGLRTPELIDEGEGVAPTLASSSGDLVYAVDTTQGFVLRVLQRQWGKDIKSEPMGLINLPIDPPESKRWYSMNSMGITHTQMRGQEYLLIAENLSSVQTVIQSQSETLQAQIGAYAVAWLDGKGSFCAFDPESGSSFSYGTSVAWYAPVDVYGEGVGYLFGDTTGLYIMSWNLDADPLSMSVYALAKEDGWDYTAGAMYQGDSGYACVLREKQGQFQLATMEITIKAE